MDERYEIAEFYREEADRYDETRLNNVPGQLKHRRQTRALANVLEDANVDEDDPILEVGCGTGRFLDFLNATGCGNLFGVDQARGMVEQTVDKSGAEGVVGDGYRLPFESDAFEVVYSIHVLMHLPNKERFIDELKRVSRNLVVFELNNRHSFTGLAPLYRRIRNRRTDPNLNQSTSVGTIGEYAGFLSPWETSYVPTYRLPLSGPMGERYYERYPRLEGLYESVVPDRFASQLLLVARAP